MTKAELRAKLRGIGVKAPFWWSKERLATEIDAARWRSLPNVGTVEPAAFGAPLYMVGVAAGTVRKGELVSIVTRTEEAHFVDSEDERSNR